MVNFTEAVPTIKKIFSGGIKIYLTPDTFVAKFCGMFKAVRLAHSTAAELKQWLGGLHMKSCRVAEFRGKNL